jgi:integrase/recombinase XerD
MLIDEVIQHYLTDVSNKDASKHTLAVYRRNLLVLSRLLAEKCQVTELEAVTVLHLRECVRMLLTSWVTGGPREDTPRRRWGRVPDSGGKLAASSVHYYARIWKLYLESFGSRQARKDHNSYSPVALLHLNKRSKGKRGT